MSRDQAANDSEHEPQPGDVIADRYRIEHKLGTGGMGVVLAAQHVALKQRVAIKLMLPDALRDATAVSRFMREAWAASKINSEYVTRVFDLGALPNGAPYLVMEYLEGYDLSTRVKREGKLPLDDVLDIGLQVCEALAEAHALGIVHRDLKPSNVFCVRRSDGRTTIKVLDFGISKVTQDRASEDELSLTRTLTLMGSPLYMSPEQMSSAKSVDARADVWSLGIILYELLSGRVPFRGESLPDLAVAIATQTPRPLSASRQDLPKKLDGVIARCLEKNRDHRYANVAELARALSALAAPPLAAHAERAERVLRNASVTLSTWGDADRQAVVTPLPGSEWRETKPRSTLMLAMVGVSVLLAAAGIWYWQSSTKLEAAPHLVVPAKTQAVEQQADDKAQVPIPDLEAAPPTAAAPTAAAPPTTTPPAAAPPTADVPRTNASPITTPPTADAPRTNASPTAAAAPAASRSSAPPAAAPPTADVPRTNTSPTATPPSAAPPALQPSAAAPPNAAAAAKDARKAPPTAAGSARSASPAAVNAVPAASTRPAKTEPKPQNPPAPTKNDSDELGGRL